MMTDKEVDDAHRELMQLYDTLEDALGVVLGADDDRLKNLLELGVRVCGLASLVVTLNEKGPPAVISLMGRSVTGFNVMVEQEISRMAKH